MAKINFFISYSHDDTSGREELEKWLKTLQNNDLIDTWCDKNIFPGEYFEEKIFKEIASADVTVGLLSQAYLASDFCKREMEYAFSLPNHKFIPIILKPSTWLDTKPSEVQALPQHGLAIEKWDNQDEAWHSVYEGLKAVVLEMQSNFKPKDDFVTKEIEKIDFVTQNKKGTKLSDLFVFPNLESGEDAFEVESIDEDAFRTGDKKTFIVKGTETSGKSSLLKWLYMNLGDDYSPLYLDGMSIFKTRNFGDHFEREFYSQMTGDFGAWMECSDKVALIDNFHHGISNNILEYLNDNFAMTIIAMDDEEYLLYFMDEPVYSGFSVVTIKEFDLAQQEELIRKWFVASNSVELEEISDLDIDKLEARVNNVITTQRIVPRYPFYILSILQSLEPFMPSGLQITSYGYCYHALITAQLIERKNIQQNDVDTCFNYLKTLAFDIYSKTKSGDTYSKEIYDEFRDFYKTEFIIKESLINKLENGDSPILKIKDDSVRFEHAYAYYFFLGMQIASEQDDKVVSELCENIHLRENSFVLIFTVHHASNKDMLDTIRLHCVYSFDTTEPARLCPEETEFMNELVSELPQSIISNKSVSENRQLRRKNRGLAPSPSTSDSRAQKKNKELDSDNPRQVDIVEVNRAIRIMEVLGQILKNRAGSFKKSDVEEILEDTVELGLRILGIFLDDFKKPEFVEFISRKLDEQIKKLEETKQRELDDDQKIILAEKMVQFFGYVITVGMLGRIFKAISSDKLVDSMASLAEEKSSPAYDLVNCLIVTSQGGFNVDYVKSLVAKYDKTKNLWAKRVLSYYVQDYLNTHNVNYKDRQKLFSTLSLSYKPVPPQVKMEFWTSKIRHFSSPQPKLPAGSF